MNKALVWIRDNIVSGVIVGLILVWLGSVSLDGIFLAADQSWSSLGSWTLDPIAVPRWQLLIALGGLAIYGLGVVAYVVRANRRIQLSFGTLCTGLTDAFNTAAKEIESGPSNKPSDVEAPGPGLNQMKNIAIAMELTQLESEQVELLKFFATSYSRGDNWPSSREAARRTGLSILRTDQQIDRLVSFGMLDKYQYRDASGKCYSLSEIGREWLLANGHE